MPAGASRSVPDEIHEPVVRSSGSSDLVPGGASWQDEFRDGNRGQPGCHGGCRRGCGQQRRRETAAPPSPIATPVVVLRPPQAPGHSGNGFYGLRLLSRSSFRVSITPSKNTVVAANGAGIAGAVDAPTPTGSTAPQGLPLVPSSPIIAACGSANGGDSGTVISAVVSRSSSMAVSGGIVRTTAPVVLVATGRTAVSAALAGSGVIAHDELLQSETWAPSLGEARWLDDLSSLQGRVRVLGSPMASQMPLA